MNILLFQKWFANAIGTGYSTIQKDAMMINATSIFYESNIFFRGLVPQVLNFFLPVSYFVFFLDTQ